MNPLEIKMTHPRPAWFHPVERRRWDRRKATFERVFNSFFTRRDRDRINLEVMHRVREMYEGDLTVPLSKLP